MQGLDRKFSGVVVCNKDGRVIPVDQWMIFLAKDNALPPTLQFYLEECERQGADENQLRGVRLLINRVHEFRKENPAICKTPDSEPNECD